MINKTERVYLMLGGTFLPGIILVGAYSILSKKPVSFQGATNLMLFAAGSAIGGYMTANMIKKAEKAR